MADFGVLDSRAIEAKTPDYAVKPAQEPVACICAAQVTMLARYVESSTVGVLSAR